MRSLTGEWAVPAATPFPAPWACVMAAVLAAAWFLVHAVCQGARLGWDPDIALYVLNARNIAYGLPYAETGYIFNPLNAIHPAVYPPGLPLLLAPVYLLKGIDLPAMKAVVCLCFALFLYLFFVIARLYLDAAAALAVMAIVGLSGLFRDSAALVLSEYPFMLLAFAGLLLIHRIQQPPGIAPSARIVSAIAAGVLMALATETRSIGVLLIPVVLVAAIVRVRRTGRASLIASFVAVAVAVACIFAINRMLPHDNGTYFTYFRNYSFSELARGLVSYIETIPENFLGVGGLPTTTIVGVSVTWIGYGLAAGMLGLAAYGLGCITWRLASVFEVFALAYAAFIIIYPIRWEPERYALPIYPLLVLYAAVGVDRATRAFTRWPARALAAGVLAAVALVYVTVVSNAGSGGGQPWVLAPEGRNLFRAIVDETPPDAVVLADEPTTIALFTGRRSAIWPLDATARTFRDYARSIGATHVVERHAGEIPPDEEAEASSARDMAASAARDAAVRGRQDLELLYASGEVALYRIKP